MMARIGHANWRERPDYGEPAGRKGVGTRGAIRSRGNRHSASMPSGNRVRGAGGELLELIT